MSAIENKKRKRADGPLAKLKARPRKFKRANSYHSSSEDEDGDGSKKLSGANLEQVQPHVPRPPKVDDVVLPNLVQEAVDAPDSDSEEHDLSGAEDGPEENASPESSDNDEPELGSDSDEASTTPSNALNKRKRNDPTRLATSISKILDAKLTTTQRNDPVLSRSKDASTTVKEISEIQLEAKARRKLRDDKRVAMERGRVKDVLGIEDKDISTAEVAEQEKKLRKMAQRGVVKLFNAVRAAQVKGEEAARTVSAVGVSGTAVVGADRRKEKVNEMSKKGFLDLLAGDGTT